MIFVKTFAVLSSLKEPMPGWIDSWAGPTAYAYGTARGIYRTLQADKDVLTDIVPADMVTNMIVAIGYKIAIDNLKSGIDKNSIPPIYTCSSGSLNPINWKVFFDNITDLSRNYPLSTFCKNYP